MSLTKQEFAELVAKAGAGTLADEEAATLEAHRAKNAVILAAGICRRCAPVSYDVPKPLIEVRGERIIERQIRQLLSVGVTDITVVVGYKKEQFEYLAEKYGVSFVENPKYVVTNNIVSLAQAADRLGNTYILYGDQFFTVNPFERYVYRSFYATTLTDSEDAWVMETDPDGVVTDMVTGEDGGEKLQGPCYVDAETGAALAKALEETLADASAADKSWEHAWYLHRDKLSIVTRYYPKGVVNSFKSMDDLMAFDDSYLLRIDSKALNNICGVLNCKPEDLYDFEPLTGGNTNFLTAFNVGDKRYAYRYPFGFSPIDINRAAEAFANEEARKAGVDPTFIYEDPQEGWKLSYFIKGARPTDVLNLEEALAGARLIAQFQAATKGVTIDYDYDCWAYAQDYMNRINERNYVIDEHTMSYHDRIVKLAEYVAADNFPKCLSNNDCWFANFLWDDEGKLYFIDWEFAGMSDWLTDIAKHVESAYAYLPASDRDFMWKNFVAFLDREPTPEEWRHFMAMVMLRAWWVCVYVIDFVSASEMASDWDVFGWLKLSWDLFDEQLDYALSLYEEA